MSDAYLVMFNSVEENFHAGAVYDWLQGFSVSTVWNYLPGVYAIRSDTPFAILSEKLKEYNGNFLIAKFDPTEINGMISGDAWKTWIEDTYYDVYVSRARELNLNVDLLQLRRKRLLKLEAEGDAL